MRLISRILIPTKDPILEITSVQRPLTPHPEIRLCSSEPNVTFYLNDTEALALVQQLTTENAQQSDIGADDIKIHQGVKTIEIPRKYRQITVLALYRVLLDTIPNSN